MVTSSRRSTLTTKKPFSTCEGRLEACTRNSRGTWTKSMASSGQISAFSSQTRKLPKRRLRVSSATWIGWGRRIRTESRLSTSMRTQSPSEISMKCLLKSRRRSSRRSKRWRDRALLLSLTSKIWRRTSPCSKICTRSTKSRSTRSLQRSWQDQGGLRDRRLRPGSLATNWRECSTWSTTTHRRWICSVRASTISWFACSSLRRRKPEERRI